MPGKPGKLRLRKMPRFVNAQNMKKKHPTTFKAPPARALAKVDTGDLVKICTSGERFWVVVTRREGGCIWGKVNNDLIMTEKHGLKLGSIVRFKPHHIYSISG